MKTYVSRGRALLAGTAAVLALVVAGCSGGGSSNASGGGGATQGGPQKVTLCTGAQPDYAPMYVAKEMGMWLKDYNLDVTLKICATSPIAIASTLKNEVQASNNSITGVATAVGQGIPVKVIFPTTYQPQKGNTGVLVMKNSDIKTFTDLQGKTLGTITVQGLFHLGIADAIKIQGGDPNKMKVVGAAPTDLQGLLTSGKVDAVMIQDATLTQILDKIGNDVRDIGNPFSVVPWGKDLVIGAMVASDTQLKENPDLYKKLQAGWAQAITLTKANPDVEKKVLAQFTGLSPDLLNRITWGEWTTTLPEGSTDQMLNTMLSYGFVKSVPKFSDIYWDGK